MTELIYIYIYIDALSWILSTIKEGIYTYIYYNAAIKTTYFSKIDFICVILSYYLFQMLFLSLTFDMDLADKYSSMGHSLKTIIEVAQYLVTKGGNRFSL